MCTISERRERKRERERDPCSHFMQGKGRHKIFLKSNVEKQKLVLRIRFFGSPGSGSGKIPDPDPLTHKKTLVIQIFSLCTIV